MKLFDKTLDEIWDIIDRINEELYPGGQDYTDEYCGYNWLTFELTQYSGMFKFNEIPIIDSENHVGWQYIEEKDEYEDIEISVRRKLNDLFSRYKNLQLNDK